VQKGDTLYGIARENGVDISLLLKTNKITLKSSLKAGQILLIPRVVPAVSASPSPKPSPNAVVTPSPTATPTPSASVDIAENTAQASEGTLLSTKPYSLGAKLTWPHPGERLQVDGKLPGLLIKASKGDDVKSISTGKVIYSNPHATFGYMVMILGNNGFTYVYGGNDSSALRMGDTVKSGELIGQVGATPGFPEPEVYFSTWKDGAYIDPAAVPRD
jgi:lipoprotein NlpD